jgi:hypothetical protein
MPVKREAFSCFGHSVPATLPCPKIHPAPSDRDRYGCPDQGCLRVRDPDEQASFSTRSQNNKVPHESLQGRVGSALEAMIKIQKYLTRDPHQYAAS